MHIFRWPKAAILLLLSLGVLGSASVGYAQVNRQQQEADKISRNAAKVFADIQSSNSPIPHHVLEKAKAIAVFPGVLKAAFIGVGGEGGKGLISHRVEGGWSVPAFFHIGGGSIGFQVGVNKTDLILLFMTEDSLKSVMQSKFEIGGEASAAAGPVGREAAALTDAQLRAGILSYSKGRGLFVGAALTGVWIDANDKLNRTLYGKNAKHVLFATGLVPADETVTNGSFPATLKRLAK